MGLLFATGFTKQYICVLSAQLNEK